ncbi:MAG: CHAP domain-containing protein [Acidimicrobiales bacterium]
MAPPLPPRRTRGRHRRFFTGVVVLVLLGAGVLVARHALAGPPLSPLRARIVAAARGQVGYQTDPSDTYCNKFSAYWEAGIDDCGNDNLDEEWCADFAAWVWKQAGAEVSYQLAPGYLNGNSASFYVWGTDHGTWHPLGSGYTPQPGDVAVYGLDTSAVTAVHVAVVIGTTGNDAAPDVINGDGDRTGYSVVEVGDNQAFADVKGKGAPLSGYVSPTPS